MSAPSCTHEWRCRSMMALAVVFPVLLAMLLSWYGFRQQPEPFLSVPLRPATANSVKQLEALFSKLDYTWPPQKTVPAVAVRSLPPGFKQLQVQKKKSLFFRSLLPLVVAENDRLRAERDWLQRIETGRIEPDPERLQAMAKRFRIDVELSQKALLKALLQRVDVVPPGLVLAQAANESGWGTSRFAREVNNLFGQWTWDADKGVVPRRRAEGANHFVRRFASLRESVRAYLHNINTGHAYAELRAVRASMRSKGISLDPLHLATGLEKYSARGTAYVQEIQTMIRSNGLNKLGPLDLSR